MVDIDFNQYSTEELRELNHNLVEHLRLRQQRDSQRSMENFNLYDTVAFIDSNGDTVEGRIIRFNQKTITVEIGYGQHWRVSPQFLKKVVRSEPSKRPINRPEIVASIVNKVPEIPPGTSRNAPCPCGSGKKYKRCCLDRSSH